MLRESFFFKRENLRLTSILSSNLFEKFFQFSLVLWPPLLSCFSFLSKVVRLEYTYTVSRKTMGFLTFFEKEGKNVKKSKTMTCLLWSFLACLFPRATIFIHYFRPTFTFDMTSQRNRNILNFRYDEVFPRCEGGVEKLENKSKSEANRRVYARRLISASCVHFFVL